MITFPSRLREARQRLEAGEAIDWRRLAELQALDLAVMGEDFAAQAITTEEAATDELERILNGG